MVVTGVPFMLYSAMKLVAMLPLNDCFDDYPCMSKDSNFQQALFYSISYILDPAELQWKYL